MLFPKSTFRVLLPDGFARIGGHVDGVLEVDVPEDIPRTEGLEVQYTVRSWAGFGSGKNRSVQEERLFTAPFVFEIPEVLPAGTHRYALPITLPPGLPPAYAGDDCAVEHRVSARLDVDWAIDPKFSISLQALPPPIHGAHRQPLITRSSPGLHERIVIEISLASTVIAAGEPVIGEIALRGGHEARFDFIEVALCNIAVLRGGTVRRRSDVGAARIPAAALRGGEATRFVVQPRAAFPAFKSWLIDNECMLVVRVDIPFASDPEFAIPLHVLPIGSTFLGGDALNPIGRARMRLTAQAMAARTGLAEGEPPVLVEGAAGPVRLRVIDAPRGSAIGITAEFSFPDLELGLSLGRRGMLSGKSAVPLPEALGEKYVLRCKPPPHLAHDAASDAAGPLEAFVGELLANLEIADEVQLSDRFLGASFSPPDDDGARMVSLAAQLLQKASRIGAAIARLPFPRELQASRAAWEHAASELAAHLVPTGPALHGVAVRARTTTDTEVHLDAIVRTTQGERGPETRIEVDLRDAVVPAEGATERERGGAPELLRALREAFTEAEIGTASATLRRPGFTDDPRSLLPALDDLLSWVLEARGERRASSAYR